MSSASSSERKRDQAQPKEGLEILLPNRLIIPGRFQGVCLAILTLRRQPPWGRKNRTDSLDRSEVLLRMAPITIGHLMEGSAEAQVLNHQLLEAFLAVREVPPARIPSEERLRPRKAALFLNHLKGVTRVTALRTRMQKAQVSGVSEGSSRATVRAFSCTLKAYVLSQNIPTTRLRSAHVTKALIA